MFSFNLEIFLSCFLYGVGASLLLRCLLLLVNRKTEKRSKESKWTIRNIITGLNLLLIMGGFTFSLYGNFLTSLQASGNTTIENITGENATQFFQEQAQSFNNWVINYEASIYFILGIVVGLGFWQIVINVYNKIKIRKQLNSISNDQLSIIDANINRLGEGLRVLEEFARMTLNDAALTQTLKDVRHKTVKIDAALQKRLLGARDSTEDVGSEMNAKGEAKNRDIAGIISANAKRAQESLRVLEEFAKIPEYKLDSEEYRKARFELYTIEKELMGKVLRKEKVNQITGLYAVVDTEWLKGRQPVKTAEQIIKGGAKIIQLRCKERSRKEFLDIAKDLKEVCSKKGVLFIVNDSVEVAVAVNADGLHIGQEDLPVNEARKQIPIDMILGCSVSSIKEAVKAQQDGADYLGVGAIFVTETKKSAKSVGLKIISDIKKTTGLPVVAIGGINKENLDKVISAGADSAAVISAVMGADNIEKATRELANIFKGMKR